MALLRPHREQAPDNMAGFLCRPLPPPSCSARQLIIRRVYPTVFRNHNSLAEKPVPTPTLSEGLPDPSNWSSLSGVHTRAEKGQEFQGRGTTGVCKLSAIPGEASRHTGDPPGTLCFLDTGSMPAHWWALG